MQKVAVECYRSTGMRPFLDDLAALRMRVFHDWPYLYEGSIEEERRYLNHFAESDQSVLVLARAEDGRIVGCSTAMALSEAETAFRQPFIEAGWNLDEMMYFGESVLLPQWRGRGLGHAFFDQREAMARALGKTGACFCAVQRPADHPLRPAQARDLAPFWSKRGYRRRPELTTRFPWTDRGETSETLKPMVFWTRALLD
ncbi:MAG: GNAT family N-acetyltransferase [Wenzhouxiangella sp.]|jgi:GNAT superfamily N-acetyltransferase|nr:GNAT family N-acetyltransferase [Wenzhouxiangella sp.]